MMTQHNAAEERREIVERYKRGREPGANIDPWEDPQFEHYHKTDRYGFIHDQRLPSIDKTNSKHQKMLAVEWKRTDKWTKMIAKWDEVVHTDKFRKRIYKGIPNRLRVEVWKKLLKIDEIKKEQVDVYKTMRNQAYLNSPEIRQIDLDVNRTYRNHDIFRERYGLKQRSLFDVLAAYSIYNTEVGYCQGMSQIAALLLMYMDDEDAFWGLSALLTDRKYAMHGFFLPGFPKLLRFQQQHDAILKKFLPKLKKHVDKHDVHTNIYSVKWFFQCFLDRVPFHLSLRLWDIYLYEGERVLIAMAYNVFKMHKSQISKLKSMESIIDLLQRELEKDFGYADDEVIKSLTECMDELRRHKLDVPVSVENEQPSKPFGLLYNPTVGQVRRVIDSSVMSGRTSQIDERERPVNGHPSHPSPMMIMSGVNPRPISEERLSRPHSRQMTQTPSFYDNVELPLGRINKVRPSDHESSGDHHHQRYVSYVQVNTGGQDRASTQPMHVVETSQEYTREYTYGPVKSPSGQENHGLVKRESLRATSASPPRPGLPHTMEMTIPSKPYGNGREVANGGPTVIRIG